MTCRTMLGLGYVLVGVLASSSAYSGQERRSTFNSAEAATRARILNDIAAQRPVAAGTDIGRLLHDGLLDGDARLRERALLAVASRAGGPRFLNTAETRGRWHDDRATIQALRPFVRTALRDSDARVRHSAVLALGNMDYDPNRAGVSQALGRETIGELLAIYDKEPSGRVREEIVKGFALTSNDSRQLRELVTRAFDDQHVGTRQYAAVAAGRLKGAEFLEKLVSRLQQDHRTVRLACAQALASYGASATGYLNEVKSIRDRETDSTLGTVLTRTIEQIERPNPR